MRGVFITIAVLALVGLLLTKFKIIYDLTQIKIIKEVKLTDIIEIVLSAVLVAVTICYAILTAQSVRASKEMAIQMKQTNRINFQPYVLIEGVSKEQEGVYAIIKAPNGDFLKYNIYNVGNIPARNINHSIEVYEINNKTGAINEIPCEQEKHTQKECLFPKNRHNYTIKLGQGIIYREDISDKEIRVKLKITYQGLKDDFNTYYYSIQWRIKPCKQPEELTGQNMVVEETDTGII
jgi:hypothetical protein